MDMEQPPSTPCDKVSNESVWIRIGHFLLGFFGFYLTLAPLASLDILWETPTLILSGLLVIGLIIYLRKRQRWIARGILAAVLLPFALLLLLFGMCTIGPWKMAL